MISYDKRCIFIHIPKCGGTSIENVIWPHPEDLTEANLWWGFVSKYHNKYQTGGLQHLLARQVRSEVGLEIFNSFYKFTIVRNPWDRIVSQFAYMQTRSDLMDFIGMQPETEFKAYLGLIQKKQHVQWMPQTDFILDQDGTL
ncbi:MAG: sulfotransferase family protein, partial [Synechococcus sp. MOX_bin73]|nr:sulfotransferase family protein [Synechococcus sp. MOX_bin73]